MKAIRDLLRDRRRSQRGSVLSGVLIMTAFIAILSGALMTELSTNFLLANDLLNRVDDEATVNSAVEVALNRMQTTPIYAGCPALSAAALNSLTAASSYTSCWPTVREQPQYTRYPAVSTIKADGSHAVNSRAGLNLYLVGDSSGDFYQFTFGRTTPNWSTTLGASVSGPPLDMPDLSESDTNDTSTLVPLSAASNPPAECQSGGCVAFLAADGTNPPDGQCYMAARGAVTAQPADAVNSPTVVFFGDRSGYLFAYLATETGGCASEATPLALGQPVVAGPVVFAGPVQGNTRTDELYVLTADGGSSWLRQLTYTSKNGQPGALAAVSSLQLPTSAATGLAVDAGSLPARLAVTFAGGAVALVQVKTGFGMASLGSTGLPGGIADAPAWCCGSAPTLIGVGDADGLYVLNANLNVVASYGVTGTTISTSPAGDAAGDWFFGANDGNLYEVPAVQSAPTLLVLGSGQLGAVSSSVQLGACGTWLCAYLASGNGGVYAIEMDARQAMLSSCVISGSACSGMNPRLRAQVEVGSAASQLTVHVEGWSYYSG